MALSEDSPNRSAPGAVMGVLAGLTWLPTLLPAKSTPATTMENQILALALWGVLVVGAALFGGEAASRWPAAGQRRWRSVGWWVGCWVAGGGLLLCLALLVQPATATTGGCLAAAGVVWMVLARLSASAKAAAWDGLMGGLVVAGLISAGMAVVQIHLPAWAGSDWLPHAAQGRATAALRQPNHLSTLLMWAVLAWIWCVHRMPVWLAGSSFPAVAASPAGLGWDARRSAWRRGVVWAALVAGMALLIYGMVLSASRTGLLGVLLLGLWGVLDRRLPAALRWPLVLAPVLYGLGWALTQGLATMGAAQGGGVHLPRAGGDISSSRFGIWANTWALIRDNPWLGVGWGEFNFAWTLTPFPGRPLAFFDHTHNLFLQLAVELGLPAACLALALAAWALWRAFAGSRHTLRRLDLAPTWALIMVLLVGLHSLLEYPLWYTYFLMPTVMALAVAWPLSAALGSPAAAPLARSGEPGEAGETGETALRPQEAASARPAGVSPATPHPVVLIGGLLVVFGSVAALWDYRQIRAIYAPPLGAAPLAERIERGQRSWFFAPHAHYAAATVDGLHARDRDALPAIQVASHQLLDTRLMIAWARALNDAGDVDRARYLVQRLREFRNPNAEEFLAECDEARVAGDATARPFQCTPPERAYRFSDFR